MAEVSNKIIKITVDTDKAKIKIEGVEGYFRKAETAAKALNNVLEENTKKWGRTEAALSQQISSLKQLRASTAGTTEEYQKQTIRINELEKEYNDLIGVQSKAEESLDKTSRSLENTSRSLDKTSKSTKKAAKGIGSMESSAGIAGATVNELGRTISDMPYGLTAITNNISQLGSMFAILVQKTGSVTKAFKSLFTTLKASPALVALLAFQAVVAIIDVFAQNARKANKEIKELNDSIDEQTQALETLIRVRGDLNGTLSRELELRKAELALKVANKKLVDIEISQAAKRKELDKQLVHYKGRLQELEEEAQKSREKGNEYDALLIENGKTKATLNRLIIDNAEETNQLNIERNKIDQDYLDKLDNLNQKELERRLSGEGTISFYKDYIKRLQDFQQNSAKSSKEFEAASKAILYWESKIAEIGGKEDGLDKLGNFLDKWRQKRVESEAGTKQEILELQRSAALQEAKELKAGKETILEINAYYDSEIHKSTRVSEKKLQLDTELLYTEKIETLKQYLKRKRDVEKNGQEADKYLAEEEEKLRQEKLDKQIAIAQAVGSIVSGVADNIDAAYQKELDIEQNKTNELNNQLRERLANEQLSADERKNIQGQIAKNDEDLRLKQEAIEKKRFKANKAAAIAEATISTFLAATGVLKDTKGGSVARIAGMVAVIGAGLAQVAMIAKQQFVSSQSSTGAGTSASSGGAAQVQAPDFNVVGQSSSNQIASVIQSQMQNPIRTYVVSKDVSTAQEMDRNIVKTASLG